MHTFPPSCGKVDFPVPYLQHEILQWPLLEPVPLGKVAVMGPLHRHFASQRYWLIVLESGLSLSFLLIETLSASWNLECNPKN